MSSNHITSLQIHDLKDELSKAKSSSSAIVVTAKEEQQQQGGKLERERERSNSDMDKKTEKNIGPMSVDIVLDDSSPEHKTTQRYVYTVPLVLVVYQLRFTIYFLQS